MLQQSIIQALPNMELYDTHRHTHTTNHILKVSTIRICSWLVLLSWHAYYVGSWLYISDRAVLYIILLSSLQSCMQWEDEMVWTRLETQIDGAARLMKICNEHAGRQAVQYIEMCHNAWIQQPSLQPRALSLSLSRSVIPLCLHSSFCLSNSCPFLPLWFSPLPPPHAFSHSQYVIFLSVLL